MELAHISNNSSIFIKKFYHIIYIQIRTLGQIRIYPFLMNRFIRNFDKFCCKFVFLHYLICATMAIVFAVNLMPSGWVCVSLCVQFMSVVFFLKWIKIKTSHQGSFVVNAETKEPTNEKWKNYQQNKQRTKFKLNAQWAELCIFKMVGLVMWLHRACIQM